MTDANMVRFEVPLPRTKAEVAVIYTGLEPTLAALRAATGLAEDRGARIRLLVPQVVPFPVPISEPPVKADFAARRFKSLVHGAPVEITVQICLCRDWDEGVLQNVPPRSVVVFVPEDRWWRRRRVRRVARILRERGNPVIVPESV